VASTRQACAHLGISTEGWQNIWEAMEWFRSAERNDIACTSTKRSQVRMTAAMFASTTRQAAAWLLAVAPNTSAGDIDELTALLDNGCEPSIASLHQLISRFREGATHTEVCASCCESDSLVSRINLFFGFGQAREDGLMDLAFIAAGNGWSARAAKQKMGERWSALGVNAESSINKRIQEARKVISELAAL
jgi:hypothetical protein